VLNRHCLAQAAEEEQAKVAYKAQLARFKSFSLLNSTQSRATIARDFLKEADNNGFLVVSNKHRRGRLTLLSRANTTGIPSITLFLKVLVVQFRSLGSTMSPTPS